ncbi:MAG: carboxypeptidase-like regulatory domain-containing protein, partial [Patescibacteria group bacterium]
TVLAAVMVLIQLAVYFVANRLARPRKPKSWGIVYDEKTGRPVSRVVARIFEPKYNKLLETQVTDNKGRYSFLLGPAEYFAVFEKEGYRSEQIRPIDYTKVDGAQDFSTDIKLMEKD